MTSNYKDPELKIKLNTGTVIKFDGSDHVLMVNHQIDSGYRVKYDILLIVFEIVEWKLLVDILAPWPEPDQNLILECFEKMEEQHLIVTSEFCDPKKPLQSKLSNHLGKDIHINVENHHAMLRDFVRLAAYRRAIERAVTSDTVALDLGCGSGILALFAATAGAKKVYAIEKRPDIILLAQSIAEKNELNDSIQFIEGLSNNIPEAFIAPKPTLFISEILGNGILDENVLEYTIDARKRFLIPDAQLIPYQLDIYLFAFDAGFSVDRELEVEELNDLYKYDFEPLKNLLAFKVTSRVEYYNPLVYKSMSNPLLAYSIDLRTIEEPTFSTQLELSATEDGQITSFACYFKVFLDEQNILTNSPWAPKTHWTQIIYSLAKPLPVKKGTVVKVNVNYDKVLQVSLVE